MDALIFDLDGTLADTLADISDAMNHVLAAHGLPTHPPETYRRLIGEGAQRLARGVLPKEAEGRAQEILGAFRERYFAPAHLMARTRPYPGIADTLATLQDARVPMAVLSNKPHEATCRIVEALFSDVTFARVLGDRPGVPRKPDPGTALELCAALATAPGRVGLVGDTHVDMQTARAAGAVAVGVEWGFRGEAELRANGAQHVIAHPRELLALVAATAQR